MAQAVQLICENYPVDEVMASREFYESNVYSLLEQEETRLWHFSQLTLFNMYDEEKRQETLRYREAAFILIKKTAGKRGCRKY